MPYQPSDPVPWDRSDMPTPAYLRHLAERLEWALSGYGSVEPRDPERLRHIADELETVQ